MEKAKVEDSMMNINELPFEMIAEIFGYLSPQSLERAILTCKLWKQIIEESCRWSWEVDLSVPRVGKWIEFSQITKRKFNKFSINTAACDERDLENVLNILKIHGSNVVQLILSECCWKLNFLMEVLNCLPKLRHLELIRTKLLLSPLNDFEVPLFMQLRSVKIVLCFFFQEYQDIVQPNIKPTFLPRPFNKFLKSQNHLTSLSINSEFGEVEDSTILQALDKGMPFQLTHLSLEFHNLESDDCSNLTRFLAAQATTITSMAVSGKYSEAFYQFVLSNLKQLKCLRLAIASLPKDETFYMRLKPNTGVTSLILEETILFYSYTETLCFTCPRWFKEFLRCVPKVTTLSLNARCCVEAIAFVSYNLRLVTKLAVQQKIDDPNVLHFPKLFSLSITDLEVDDNWMKFVRNNIQIKELELSGLRKDVNVDTVDAIQELIESLKPLKLNILRIGKRLRLVPIYQSSVKGGKLISHWNDLEWFVDGKRFSSFARKLISLRLSIATAERSCIRLKRGTNVIDLEIEILLNSFDH